MMDRRAFLMAAGLGGAALATGGGGASAGLPAAQGVSKPPAYIPRDFSHLLGLAGFSETLLKNHFTLYQGYVANTNRTLETLDAAARDGKLGAPEAAELRRRFGWEFDGMRLHELYFGNLGGKAPLDGGGRLASALASQYGSLESWERDFRSVGAMRGIGWAVLFQDPANGRLMNTWVDEHDRGILAGGRPLLILDVFEHAFMIDYGLRKADYIEAFFKAVDWAAVEARLG